MTPKEKAKELVDKMYNTPHCGIEHFPSKHYCDCSEINFSQAKQCALVAVNEMLGLGAIVGSDLSDSFYIYWEEVKQEIKNL
jgi:hypothetical protein